LRFVDRHIELNQPRHTFSHFILATILDKTFESSTAFIKATQIKRKKEINPILKVLYHQKPLQKMNSKS